MSLWKGTAVVLSFLVAAGAAEARGGALCASLLTQPISSPSLEAVPGNFTSPLGAVPENITSALENTFAILEQHYAPLQLKATTVDLNWEQLKTDLRQRMAQARDSREAMLIFAELFHQMDDAHVSVRLPSSWTLSLPLQVFHTPTADGQKGPLVLSYILPAFFEVLEFKAGNDAFKDFNLSQLPRVGDEVVKIQGMDPELFFKTALGSAYHTNGNSLTNYSAAAMGLSRLRESSGVDFEELRRWLGPDMTLKLTLKRQMGDGGTYELAVPYFSSGYSFVNYVFEKDGQTVRYPDGLSPYDPNRIYVPTDDTTVEMPLASKPQTYYHKLKQAVQVVTGSAQDLAVRLNPNYRALEKFLTVDLPRHPAAAQAQKITTSLHDLFNLGSEAQKYSFTEPQLNENQEVVSQEGLADGAINIGHYEPLVELPKNFKRIQPPRLFRGLLNSSSFFAGTFERDGKRVGYLRIPSYNVENVATIQFAVRYYLGQLEQNSDYLILDQINNPGGYVFFSDLLIKGFTGKYDHDRHMKFAVRPTSQFLQQMPQLLHAVEQVATTRPKDRGLFKGQLLDEKEVHRLLRGFDEDKKKIYRVLDPDYQQEARSASMFEDELGLTEPISLSRLSEFAELTTDRAVWDLLGDPQSAAITSSLYRWLLNYLGVDIFDWRVGYTKPVYMWINDLDFSGGDATPAVLQDLGRAKLVGVRTAGAGGTVNSYNFWRAGATVFSTSLTTSLMVRNRGTSQEPWWVENEGVHPDIPFAITDRDIASGFKGTLERLLEAIDAESAE